MLHLDVVQLKQFYATRLGASVAALIAQTIEQMWPSFSSDTTLVIGYGVPYIAHLPSSAPVIVAMPAEQGAAVWPAGGPNRVLLTRDGALPLQSNSINRVLLIHSIEYSEQLNAMMQEVWRVLVPGGRVLAMVPNRVSLWSGSSKTPFGFGRPFNGLQLRALFTNHQFTLSRSVSALFAPPMLMRVSHRASLKLEKIGKIFWWFLGGVLIVEAEKQLYASIKEPVFVHKPYLLPVGAQTAGANNRQ